MTAPTPGQAAYETYVTFVGLPLSDWPWEADDVNQALWDAVASTAIAAQQSHAAGLAEVIDPAKLDLLADWFDNDDAIRRRLGNPEVQADLRRWAKAVRDARAGLPS